MRLLGKYALNCGACRPWPTPRAAARASSEPGMPPPAPGSARADEEVNSGTGAEPPAHESRPASARSDVKACPTGGPVPDPRGCSCGPRSLKGSASRSGTRTLTRANGWATLTREGISMGMTAGLPNPPPCANRHAPTGAVVTRDQDNPYGALEGLNKRSMDWGLVADCPRLCLARHARGCGNALALSLGRPTSHGSRAHPWHLRLASAGFLSALFPPAAGLPALALKVKTVQPAGHRPESTPGGMRYDHERD